MVFQRFTVLAAALTALLGSIAGASEPPPGPEAIQAIPEGPIVDAALWTDQRTVVPGSVFWTVVSFEIKPEWHIYWPGLNDSGMPPIFDWHLPQGWKVGAARWPVPKIHESAGGLVDHVFEGTTFVLFPIKVPQATPPGPTMISCDLEWLVCRVACVPEQQRIMTTINIASPREPWAVSNAQGSAIVDMARAKLPHPIPDSGGPVEVKLEGSTLVFQTESSSTISFYPSENGRPTIGSAGDRLNKQGPIVRINLEPDSDSPVDGIVVVKSENGSVGYLVQIPEQSDQERDGFSVPGSDHKPEPKEIEP